MAVVEEFDYLCRLCATKTGILMGLPIFEAGDQMRNIDKKIAACLPVQVSMTDQLPKVVCEECAYKLDQLFDFREKCLHTEAVFMEMLKEIAKQEIVRISKRDLEEVEEMKRIQRNIDRIQNNMENVQNHVNPQETAEPTIHTMQVIDEIDLAAGEQVVTQEEIGQQDTDIEVTGIDCLDGDTARMVDEHIREVSNHQIAMHLEGDMTVVGNLTVSGHLSQLGINYVTSINPEDQNRESIVHYCDNVKYESVPIKQEYHRLRDRLTTEDPANVLEDNVPHENFAPAQPETGSDIEETRVVESETPRHTTSQTNTMASTSQITTGSPEILVEYTKRAKHALLETALNNPTVDETGSHWYVCPFCNEATLGSNNMIAHFEQYFCCCPCGLYFTSVDALNVHKERCDVYKSKTIDKEKQITEPELVSSQDEVNIEEKKQTTVRQKWTPKVCTQCGKQYRTNYKLQEHMRKHTGEKPFQCVTCEKAFRSKIGLAQHAATHTGQYDYNCSTCGKGFQSKSYLVLHQRVHSDLKPFPCNTCGQHFKTKQSLLDHQNRHLGVKPYVCEICGKGFITKGLCKSHQKIHSGMDNRQYPCVVCNKMFVSKSYLNTHLRIHTGEKPMATYLGEVLEDQRDKLHENLLANNSQTSVDGESSSPEGGPDTPPNTPVTPSHKSSKEHHKQWKESEKCEPEPAACLGQHHHQRHHHHEHHHSHKHHNHPSETEKKSSYSPQGICDVRSSNDPLSAYSCYHAHWCAASTSSTPIPSPTPTSPSLSLSSNCSSEGETRWQSATRHRTTEKADRSTSNRKSLGNDDDEDDADQNNDQDQDQDHSGNLPNPGTRPITARSTRRTFSPNIAARLVQTYFPVHLVIRPFSDRFLSCLISFGGRYRRERK